MFARADGIAASRGSASPASPSSMRRESVMIPFLPAPLSGFPSSSGSNRHRRRRAYGRRETRDGRIRVPNSRRRPGSTAHRRRRARPADRRCRPDRNPARRDRHRSAPRRSGSRILERLCEPQQRDVVPAGRVAMLLVDDLLAHRANLTTATKIVRSVIDPNALGRRRAAALDIEPALARGGSEPLDHAIATRGDKAMDASEMNRMEALLQRQDGGARGETMRRIIVSAGPGAGAWAILTLGTPMHDGPRGQHARRRGAHRCCGGGHGRADREPAGRRR
jgi:hypothetical protein